MLRAPIPRNETERLEALIGYGILDTLVEQAYEDITLLASHICQTPIATISFVDKDRQWFKSKVGLSVSETPRDISFCGHAVADPDNLFVINDATLDARFYDNPLVLEDPNVRFYAGAPLLSPDGNALGTLCVIDRTPRDLSSDQRTALSALSRQVMAQLELRTALDRLQRHAEERAAYERQLEAYQLKLETANEELSQESRIDKLTRLNNRGAFDEILSEEFDRGNRRRRSLSLLMLDIDHFKSLNDSFGHPVGDVVLQHVAGLISGNVRPADFPARYGGEEFAVVLPNTEEEGAVILAERIRRAIQNHPWDHRPITASIGVATARPGEIDDCEQLKHSADAALYQAKHGGRNRVSSAKM